MPYCLNSSTCHYDIQSYTIRIILLFNLLHQITTTKQQQEQQHASYPLLYTKTIQCSFIPRFTKNRERVKQGNKFFCNPLTISFHRITHLYECPVDMVDVVSMKHRAVVLLYTSSTFSFFPFFAQQSMCQIDPTHHCLTFRKI